MILTPGAVDLPGPGVFSKGGLLEFVDRSDDSFRWVIPDPERPEMRIEVRRSTMWEGARSYDNVKKADTTIAAVNERIRIVQRSIRAWEGVGFLFGGKADPPCNDENKAKLAVMVEKQSGRALFDICMDRLDEVDTRIEKN